jgi:hypothetical protein
MDRKTKHVVRELSKFPFTVAVYMFGSGTEGKATKISDIDICVVDDTRFDTKQRKKVYQFSSEPFDVSLFSDLPLYMKYEVLKGKLVYVKAKSFLTNIKESVIREYLDTRHIWDEGLKIRKRCGYKVMS